MTTEKITLQLEEFLPYRLSVLTNTVSRAIAHLYSERFSLTVPEWRVIAVLGGSPGLSAAQVAERTAMDKVAVSRAVNSLVDANRVLRKTAQGPHRSGIDSRNTKAEGTMYVGSFSETDFRNALAERVSRDPRTT